jgi:hypothetical protein
MKIDLRKPTREDITRFKECLSADEHHAKQDADSWLAEPGEFMVFFDGEGNRVWVRIERVLRVSFQHDPATPRKELVNLVYKGLYWVIGSAREKQFAEVIFESKAPRLIQFVRKMFGFEPITETYIVRT